MIFNAIQPLPSLWITANAGSGKTTALTQRVVALLLRGVEPEHICCITYTKAAASEMRLRVLALLRSLLLADDASCRVMVEQLTAMLATEADMRRARHLFGRVLESPSGGVQLTTIHGFCQNILRRFPLEAGVAPHFTILDDGAAERLLAQAKHRLLSAIRGDDAMLADALALLGERAGELRFSSIMNAIIHHRGAWDDVWRGQSTTSLRAAIFAFHNLAADVSEAQLAGAFCQCIDSNDASTITRYLPQLLGHKNKSEQQMGRMLQAWLAAEHDAARLALIDDFCGVFITNSYTRRVRLVNDKEFPAGSPLRVVLEGLAEKALQLTEARLGLAAASESFAIALLARAMLALYTQAKAQAHALDYDDLITRTRQLFLQSDHLGWVMSKLDHRIDHLLVDEAQDTSADQWHIVSALVEELIANAGGIGSGGQPRSLLVVGDEKQSIYSFQGAAPELFASKRGDFCDMLAASAAPLTITLLDTSYRSAQAILSLVDNVAAQPEIAAALSAAGDIRPHRLHRADVAGLVAFYPPVMAPENPPLPPMTMPTEYRIVQSGAQLLAEQVAATIAGWIKTKRMLESEGRPIEPGDILVLVHRRRPIVLPLIRALERQNVPVAGLDRLTLADHLAVNDILALMQWCLNPADDLALAQVLRSPIIGISDDALRILAHGRAGDLWSAVQLSAHASVLHYWLMQRNLLPYDFLTDLLEVKGARRRFSERFGHEVQEVLDELKEQAAHMPAAMPNTLTHFCDWVSNSRQKIKREQESQASNQVRIMTVHGAKGLEAPVVMLVDTVSVPTTKNEVIYFDVNVHRQRLPLVALSHEAAHAPRVMAAKEHKRGVLIAEYQRLLYVALTRARNELHIFGMATKTEAIKEHAWYESIATSMHAMGAAHVDGIKILQDKRSPALAKKGPHSNHAHLPLPAWAVENPADVATRLSAAPSHLVAYGEVHRHDAKERGVRIHRMLQMVHAKTTGAEIARLVQHFAPDWSSSEQGETIHAIDRLFTKHRFLWQHPSRAEVAIAGTIAVEGAAIAVSGQMDLLVETPDEIIVVDYKTTRQVAAVVADVPLNYLVQLKTYHALLHQLYPDKTIRLAILWMAVSQLMWLDEAVAATPWPADMAQAKFPVAA